MSGHVDSLGFQASREALRAIQNSNEAPILPSTIDGGARASLGGTKALERGSYAVAGWFLGTKGENGDLFERMIVEAIRDHIYWRRNYHPDDPTFINASTRFEPEYRAAVGATQDAYNSLLVLLKKSVPFFSMRYQGHMNWDLTMPGMLGYFATMLYNPNNVAFEGSTATTLIELVVGDDLCRMLGYEVPGDKAGDTLARRPWGHITCDGTVANIEAIWASRNLKLFPLALRDALRHDPNLAPARDLFEVTLCTGQREKLSALEDPWPLLNLDADEILGLTDRLTAEFGLTREVISRALASRSAQHLGMTAFQAKHLGALPSPIILVPGTKHYSFPKAAAILGLGTENLRDVEVDLDARMSMVKLKSILEECLHNKQPVYSVVVVFGSTEESSVDPLTEVLALRTELRARGLNFTIHADAAWGGYHASLLDRRVGHIGSPTIEPPPQPAPEVSLSRYVAAQFLALQHADSVTVDPHKSGYIPYPAGALCYRNGATRDLLTFSAPVIYRGEAEPTVGIYGVEGSKPGASAAAVYLSHKVIRPSREGYGRILGQALYSCRKLYVRLLCLANPRDPFVVVPIPRLPAERRPADWLEGPEAQLARIKKQLDLASNDEILNNPELTLLLNELGPDQNILAYAFNFVHRDGHVNNDLSAANDLNRHIYRKLSIKPKSDIYGYDLLVSTTELSVSQYGRDFIDDYKRRLGVGDSPGDTVTVLRSVVMDPWLTETTAGSFINILGEAFRNVVLDSVAAIARDHMRYRGY